MARPTTVDLACGCTVAVPVDHTMGDRLVRCEHGRHVVTAVIPHDITYKATWLDEPADTTEVES